MLNDRTVFIVGAGASAEINLPVGRELRNQIVESVNFVNDANGRMVAGRQDLLEQVRQKHNGTGWDFEAAGQEIARGIHGRNSIDEYLDWHRANPAIVSLGKAAIVRCLMGHEVEANRNHFLEQQGFQLRVFDDKWYGVLFRMLNSGLTLANVDRLFENATFIIFNYDRVLENFFLLALGAMGVAADRAEAMCRRDGLFIHPYGMLAPLFGDRSVRFGESLRNVNSADLAENIRTFTEGDGGTIAEIHHSIATARTIVYLGFSYNETNLTMLSPPGEHEITRMFGTAFGLPDPVFEDLSGTLRRFHPRRPDQERQEYFHRSSCATFLNDYGDRIRRRA